MKIKLKCNRVETYPINRRLGEDKRFETVDLSSTEGSLHLHLTNPNDWYKFHEGMEYTIEIST